jgi:hypothetical protein
MMVPIMVCGRVKFHRTCQGGIRRSVIAILGCAACIRSGSDAADDEAATLILSLLRSVGLCRTNRVLDTLKALLCTQQCNRSSPAARVVNEGMIHAVCEVRVYRIFSRYVIIPS